VGGAWSRALNDGDIVGMDTPRQTPMSYGVKLTLFLVTLNIMGVADVYLLQDNYGARQIHALLSL
jgi:hypothetical protein